MDGAKKLACLDGLRAVAVVQVVMFHHRLEGDFQAVRPAFNRLLAPFRFGYTGVHLFLVLSGFCLTHSLIRRSRSGRNPSLLSYMRDRWWRIAPPFYVAFLVYATITMACGWAGVERPPWARVDLYQVVTHATFLHGLSDETLGAVNPPFWSLSLEFQFYLVLPLLFVLAMRIGPWRVLAGVIGLSVIWRAAILMAAPTFNAGMTGFFVARWSEFAMGMAVACWYHAEGRTARRSDSLKIGALALITLGVTFAVAMASPTRWIDFGFGAGYAAMLVAVLLSSDRNGLANACFSWKPLVWLGSISYSVYLTHNLIFDWEYKAYNRLIARPNSITEAALLATSLSLILLVGWAFHVLVERRFLRSTDPSRPSEAQVVLPAARTMRPHRIGLLSWPARLDLARGSSEQ